MTRGGRSAESQGVCHIVCVNERQARKNAADRQAIVESLCDQLKKGAKRLVGNKGYRKFLRVEKDSVDTDEEKINRTSRPQVQGIVASGAGVPGYQAASGDPPDLSSEKQS